MPDSAGEHGLVNGKIEKQNMIPMIDSRFKAVTASAAVIYKDLLSPFLTLLTLGVYFF
jgi:hypothetical protein